MNLDNYLGVILLVSCFREAQQLIICCSISASQMLMLFVG